MRAAAGRAAGRPVVGATAGADAVVLLVGTKDGRGEGSEGVWGASSQLMRAVMSPMQPILASPWPSSAESIPPKGEGGRGGVLATCRVGGGVLRRSRNGYASAKAGAAWCEHRALALEGTD